MPSAEPTQRVTFFQRHRAALAAATLVVVAIVAGSIVALWKAGQARTERDLARRANTLLNIPSATPEVKEIDDKGTNAAITLGLTLTRKGKPTEGEPYLVAALATRRKILPLDSFMIPYAESALGECLTAQKRFEEAEPLLTDGYTGLIWKLGEKDVRTVEARQRMARLYDAWDKPDQAALFR